MTSRVEMGGEGDHLAVHFPYDRTQVAAIRTIPGAAWDRARCYWRVPVQSRDATLVFAASYGFDVTDDVRLLAVPTAPDYGLHDTGDEIHLRFAYEPVKIRSVKALPSVSWDPTSKAWKIPRIHLPEAVRWADEFRLHVPAGLRAEADQLLAARAEQIAASRAQHADIDIPHVAPDRVPRDYQRAAVAYVTEHRRSFLADMPGLGKTAQAMCSLELLDAYPAVVVCPATLTLNWLKEWSAWFPHRKVQVIRGRKETVIDADTDVVVLGWPVLDAHQARLVGLRGYVFDESHMAKNYDAKRTKAAIKVAKTCPNDGVVLCLTGTPIDNRPAEFAAQLEILGLLGHFGGRWSFYRRHCAAFRDRWGQWHIDGASHLDELNTKLRQIGYIRRLKADVMTELAPAEFAPIVVEGSETGMRDYRRAEADIVAFLVERARQIAEELGLDPRSAAVAAKMKAQAAEHLVRMSVLRKLAATAKMGAVIERVGELVEAGQKVVLAAHHREIVDALAAEFGGLKIQGQMRVEDVEAAKARFQELPCAEAPVIVLSIQAAKTGHTLTAAQDVVFVELPWTPGDFDQTYSRCHRMGQRGSVTVTTVLCADTIDVEIYALIERKRAVVDAATEGGVSDVEVELAKALVGSLLAKGLGAALDAPTPPT